MDAPVDDVQFEKNVHAWAELHPKESVQLQFLDPEKFAFTRSQEVYLNLLERETRKLIYSDNPEKGVEQWFQSLNLHGVEVVLLYGAGLGYEYVRVKQWLAEDHSRRLVLIDDCLESLFYFFYTSVAADCLTDTQVSLHYFEKIEDSQKIFNVLYLKYFSRPFVFTCSSYYLATRAEKFQKCALDVHMHVQVIPVGVREYHHYGAPFFRNYYANLPLLAKSGLTNRLFGEFRQIPAVICGAGPSMEKQLPFLAKIKDRSLIFAGSSAMNVLVGGGVIPHFGGGIDPNQMQCTRYKSLVSTQFPLIYRGRVHHEALAYWQGPILYTTGSGGYDIASWVENKLGVEEEEFEEGHNVVTFFLEIIKRMGCNPIIFLGMDLAQTGGGAYAKGIEEGEQSAFNGDLVERSDIYGHSVQTYYKWLAEAEWISCFAKEHPDVMFLNATEGGIGFPGVQNISFQEVQTRYLQKKYPLEKKVGVALKKAQLFVRPEKVFDVICTLFKSLQRVFDALSQLEAMEPLSPKALVIQHDIEKEEAYLAVLRTFNAFITSYLESQHDKESDKKELLREKYAFLRRTAEVNLELLQWGVPELKELG